MREKVGKWQFSCFLKISNENNLERVSSLYPNPPHNLVSQSVLQWKAWWQRVKYQPPKFFVFSFEAGSFVGLNRLVWLASEVQSTYFFLPNGGIPSVFHYTQLFKVGSGDQTNHHVCTANILPIQLFFSVPGGGGVYIYHFFLLFSASLWIVILVFHDNSN